MWKPEAEDLRFKACLGYIGRLENPMGHFASWISDFSINSQKSCLFLSVLHKHLNQGRKHLYFELKDDQLGGWMFEKRKPGKITNHRTILCILYVIIFPLHLLFTS